MASKIIKINTLTHTATIFHHALGRIEVAKGDHPHIGAAIAHKIQEIDGNVPPPPEPPPAPPAPEPKKAFPVLPVFLCAQLVFNLLVLAVLWSKK